MVKNLFLSTKIQPNLPPTDGRVLATYLQTACEKIESQIDLLLLWQQDIHLQNSPLLFRQIRYLPRSPYAYSLLQKQSFVPEKHWENDLDFINHLCDRFQVCHVVPPLKPQDLFNQKNIWSYLTGGLLIRQGGLPLLEKIVEYLLAHLEHLNQVWLHLLIVPYWQMIEHQKANQQIFRLINLNRVQELVLTEKFILFLGDFAWATDSNLLEALNYGVLAKNAPSDLKNLMVSIREKIEQKTV